MLQLQSSMLPFSWKGITGNSTPSSTWVRPRTHLTEALLVIASRWSRLVLVEVSLAGLDQHQEAAEVEKRHPHSPVCFRSWRSRPKQPAFSRCVRWLVRHRRRLTNFTFGTRKISSPVARFTRNIYRLRGPLSNESGSLLSQLSLWNVVPGWGSNGNWMLVGFRGMVYLPNRNNTIKVTLIDSKHCDNTHQIICITFAYQI